MLITQPSKQGELCRKDERNANHKSPVLGLVVNGAHRQIDTGAAAENAQRKQRFFRHAPCAALGCVLIVYRDESTNAIDEQEPKKQNHVKSP